MIKGEGNYTGEYPVAWTITKSSIDGVEIKGVETVYDGMEHTLSVTIPEQAVITYRTDMAEAYTAKEPAYKDAC